MILNLLMMAFHKNSHSKRERVVSRLHLWWSWRSAVRAPASSIS